ncbi:protein FAM122A-like [Tropilaelaps mercedesae]|uniref:Protein FAM122A-like n=1 Tax=Tropilaelaps mercedesae TaxID=418985 RepID=A0A1V9XED0_9ACAR|nr:protein FAM122A-like [Tropilaelaps mercedesae]
MEVDSSSEETAPVPVVTEPAAAPSAVLVPQAKLKRSSSAPLLIGSPSSGGHPGLSSAASFWTTTTSAPSTTGGGGGCGSLSPSASPASPVLVSHSAFHPAQSFREGLRGRTMSVTSPGGPHSPVVPRVHQIRAEEMEAVTVREAQQERELTSKLLISQSWDDLSIEETPPSCASPSPSSPVLGGPRRLHSPPIFGCPSPSGCTGSVTGAASPSASNRQCYSPSVHRPAMRAPSSPSPTRVQRHRSQSPQMVLRPSALGAVKRKLSSDSDGAGSVGCGEPVERAKRMLTLEDSAGKESALLLQVAPTDSHS